MKKFLVFTVVIISLIIAGTYIKFTMADSEFVSNIRKEVDDYWRDPITDAHYQDMSHGTFVICKRSRQTIAFQGDGKVIDGLRFIDLQPSNLKAGVYVGYVGDIRGEYAFYVLNPKNKMIEFTFGGASDVYDLIKKTLAEETTVLVLEYY